MTASAPITPAPEFRLHGDLSPAVISAIARLLISHARRELEAERKAGQADRTDDADGGPAK